LLKVTPDAEKFVLELLDKNNKKDHGVKIYMAGMACSGPQFGMSFQKEKDEGDTELKMSGFSFFIDEEAKEALEECVVEYVDDPNFGTGLTISNPKAKGCSSCGGGCH